MNSTPLCIHWNDGLDSFAALHAIYRRFGTIATLLELEEGRGLETIDQTTESNKVPLRVDLYLKYSNII